MTYQSRIERRQAAQTEAMGYGGTLSCRPLIESAIRTIRERIGENIVMEAAWDRTGRQEFPILGDGANRSYPAIEIFGASGRFRLSAVGASLPLDSIGFRYRVDGDDIAIDPDEMIFKGLARRFDDSTSAPSSTPAGMDPLTIAWTVFSVIRIAWQVMHPKIAILLGGNVSCKAVLQGDTLTITFTQCPSVRLTILWETVFEVPSVQISAEKAAVALHGEGIIGSRVHGRDFVFE